MPADPHEEARLAPLPAIPPPATAARPGLGLLRGHRELRLLVGAQALSFGAGTLTMVALPLQAWRLSHSTLVVGLLSLAEFVPMAITAFLGGALADAVDRRRLVLATELATVAICGALIANAAAGMLWVLFALAALTSTAYGLQRPSLDAILPRIVEPGQLAAAASLASVPTAVAMVAGPVAAGLLISGAGLACAYAVAAGLYALALLAFAALRAVPPPTQAGELSLRAVADGVRYARSRRDLLGTYLVDITAMFFGIPEALMPAVAVRYGGPAVLGLLFSAAPAGALAVSVTSGWVTRVRRHGRAIALAAAGWGIGIVVFGLAGSLALALAGLAFAGGADEVSGLCRQTMWNESIPDRVRGRLAGIEMLSWSSGPTLGNVEAGAAASLVGLRASIVAGGVLCVLGTVAIAVALPALWRYDQAAGRRLREDAATPPRADTPAMPAGSSGSTRG
jgi:MFS family permease